MPIDSVIPRQRYEEIRDRIATILVAEFASQYTKSSQATPKPAVWTERSIPFDPTEIPAINITLVEGAFDTKSAEATEGTYKYHIECYTSAKSKAGSRGDYTASADMHRILGMVRAILENPLYKTLSFTAPYLAQTYVERVMAVEPQSKFENISMAQGVLVFVVRAPEDMELGEGEALELSWTKVKLYNTDKGYLWGDESAPPPDYLVTEDEDVYFIME